jgi:hypothetical protein
MPFFAPNEAVALSLLSPADPGALLSQAQISIGREVNIP